MKVFGEKKSEDFLEKEGFPVVKRVLVKKRDEFERGLKKLRFPVSMKVSSKKILHKSDVGGVLVGIRNKEEALEIYDKLSKISKSVLVQEFIEGHKVIVGIKKDDVFGHVLVFGLGGIFVEVMKDVSFRVCPVGKKDILEMIKEIKGYNVLEGARGRRANLKKLENVLFKASRLAGKYKNIEELDINPLIVNEKKAVVVDARISFE